MTDFLLWATMAALTAAAVLVVVVPLMRTVPRSPASGNVAAVYRDQLVQLDRERATGFVSDQDAVLARAEIGRRLLAATETAAGEPVAMPASRVLLARTLVLLIPVGALGAYLALGSPALPGQPLSARLSAPIDPSDVDSLVSRAEAELQRHPESVEGWALMAPVYLRLGRFSDAAGAYGTLIRLGGPTAERETMRGVALVGLAGGIVTAEARTAFERALTLDPSYAQARISLALAIEAEGDPARAAAELRAVLAATSADGPLAAGLKREIARIEAVPETGPTGEQVAAVAQMTEAQQQAMAQGMVERLSSRLEAEGGPVEEWLRLVRSYKVLGQQDKALVAAATARKAYAGDRDSLARIDALLQSLGLGG